MQSVMEENNPSTAEVVACSVLNSLDHILYEVLLEEPPRMHFLNRAVETLTGYSPDVFLACTPGWEQVVHAEDKAKYVESLKACRRSARKHRLQYRICTKDGATRDVLDHAVAVTDAAGRVTGVHGIMIDVTEQAQTQRELERSQMLQSIGKLSAGIAHEINTPIQFLGDNMRFLEDGFRQLVELVEHCAAARRSVADGENAQDCVEAVAAKKSEIDFEFLRDEVPQAIQQNLEGVKLVSAIVSAMRDFSHIDERRKAPADINRALSSTIIILRNNLKYAADVEKDLDPDLPEIMCCIDDLNQVFMNLLINACHSIEEAIQTGRYKRGLIRVRTHRDGDHVVITISDTGMGIPENIREKIFERFFTTKGKDRKGTGQGLATVLAIVRDKHNGTVSLDSEPGAGAAFTVRLPVDPGQKRDEEPND